MFEYRPQTGPPPALRMVRAAKVVLAAFVAFCLGGGVGMAEGDFSLDWSFIGEGKAISKDPYGTQGTPLVLRTETAIVADASTTPPNPFPDIEQSLFIDQGPDSPVTRVRPRAFETETPASGSYEINFRLVEGRFRLDTGSLNVPWDPREDYAYCLSDVLFGISFAVDEPIQCKSVTGLRTESIGAISPDENYTFRGEWETDGENVVFQFFLNGEQVMTKEKQTFFQPVPKASFDNQTLSFAINVGHSEIPRVRVFLGRISATAGK